MRPALLCILLLFATAVQSQVVADKNAHNFGSLSKGSNRVVDFQLTNNGDQAARILTIDRKFDISTLLSSPVIQPGKTETLRIKYNPKKIGPFNRELNVFVSTSKDPVKFSLSGIATYIDHGDSPECPSFHNKSKSSPADQIVHIKVVNKETLKPIPNSNIEILKMGVPHKKLTTDENGIGVVLLRRGPYQIIVEEKCCKKGDFNGTISPGKDTITLAIEPLNTEQVIAENNVEEGVAEKELVAENVIGESNEEEASEIAEEEEISEDVHVEETQADEGAVIEGVQIEEVIEDDQNDTPPSKSKLLPEQDYAANNIVFLIDVSRSMGKDGKMELLRSSMHQLIQALRIIDRVSVVTFSTEAKIALHSTPGNEKEKIESLVFGLIPEGKTAGYEGLSMACKAAEESFIQGGNNEIILVTDGAFNREDDNQMHLKLVKRYAKKGIKLSIVGILNLNYAVSSLTEMANAGNGNYVRIKAGDDPKYMLLDEIKSKSKIK